VYHPLARTVFGFVAIAALSTITWAQQANPFDPYADQGEVDAGQAVTKATDPAKKLDLLKEWEQKYPNSKLNTTRYFMTAQALLQEAGPAYGQTAPPALIDGGEKAAQQLVDNMDKYLSDDVKTALKVPDDQWKTARAQIELQANSVLGWTAYVKKQDDLAEKEFKKVLQLNPNVALISWSLGSLIIRQHKVERYSEALYDLARALSVTGATALPAAAQAQYNDYLKKAYSGYHGDDSGLDQLKASVVTAALPPADFHIDSITEIENKKFANQDEFNKAHPDIALWRTMRDTLKGDGGDAYFATVKDSGFPPDTIGTLKAKIVTVNEKDLVVNVDNAGGDATLKFEKALNAKVINVGDAIEFKGAIDSFTKDQYMLTLVIDDPKEDIKGLPDNAFSAAPARKAAPKKVLPKKKTP